MAGNILAEATGSEGVTVTNTVLCVLWKTQTRADGITVRDGNLQVYNMLGLGMQEANIRVEGGQSVFQGGCFYQKTVSASGGKAFLSGLIFKERLPQNAIYDPINIILFSDVYELSNFGGAAEAGVLVWSVPEIYEWGGPGGGRLETSSPVGGGKSISVGYSSSGYYQEKNTTGGAAKKDISPYRDYGWLVFELYFDSAAMLDAGRMMIELNTYGNDNGYVRLDFKEQLANASANSWHTVRIRLFDFAADGVWTDTDGKFNPKAMQGMRIRLINYPETWSTQATDRLYFKNVRFQNEEEPMWVEGGIPPVGVPDIIKAILLKKRPADDLKHIYANGVSILELLERLKG